MPKSQNVKLGLYLLISLVPLLFFQNCSEDVGFIANSNESVINSNGNPDPVVPEVSGDKVFKIAHTPGAVFPDVDILFVVDESSSMNSILQNLRNGFASVNTVSFPANTRIAFTNMAPAQVDAAGEVSFNAAFAANANIPLLPGYMGLVDGQSIQTFLDNPAVSNGLKSKFPEAGCAPWFIPGALNTNGKSCIEANSQIVLLGTGIEAGVASLYQVAKNKTANNKKLFRDGALANVVFVSDTHDPGGNYYGRPNAYSNLIPVEEIKASLLENSPQVAGIKFNGILPLPELGNPLLAGLNTIGNLATTAQQVNALSNEGLNSFNYLDYIKQTDGAAIHIGNSDWKTAVESMVQTIGTTDKPLLKLKDSCDILKSISMDGVLLDGNQTTLIDSTTIRIEKDNLLTKEYIFDIVCGQ